MEGSIMTSKLLKNIQKALSTSCRVYVTNVTTSQLTELLKHKGSLPVPIAVFRKGLGNGDAARTVKHSRRVLALSLVGAEQVPFHKQRCLVVVKN
jgi:hypothetical protein